MSDQSTPSLHGLTCPSCNYDLNGLTQNICPECGERFDPDQLRMLLAVRRPIIRPLWVISCLAGTSLVFTTISFWIDSGILRYRYYEFMPRLDASEYAEFALVSLIVCVVASVLSRPRPPSRFLALSVLPALALCVGYHSAYSSLIYLSAVSGVLALCAFIKDLRGSIRILGLTISAVMIFIFIAFIFLLIHDIYFGWHWSIWANPYADMPGQKIALTTQQSALLSLVFLPLMIFSLWVVKRCLPGELRAWREQSLK